MFRKISSLLVIFLCSSLLRTSAFGQDYKSTYTTVRKTCEKLFSLSNNQIITRLTSCVENDPETEEIFNTAIDWYGEPFERTVFYELVRTSSGFVVRSFECRGALGIECTEPKDTPIKMATPYVLQKIAPEEPSALQKVSKDSISAAPNRLFTTGPNTAALKNDYVAYVLNADDFPTTAKKVIFTNPTTKTSLGGSVAPDGGMAVQLIADSSTWTLITRKLKDGVPIAAPFSWTVPAYTGYSLDITNTIEVNSGAAGASLQPIRYIVFRAFRNVGTAGQASQILIQTIDDATGQPTGPARALTNFAPALQATAEAIQGDAISPDGKLLLFTSYASACKRQIAKIMALANGQRVGPIKTVVPCAGLAETPGGVIGLDMMLPETAPLGASSK